MTTVATRARVIAELEGFDIIVKRDGAVVDPKSNGMLGPYGYEKKLKHTSTVKDWKRERFERTYPGYTCDVLCGDGQVAAPQATLRTVRESYEE